MGRKQDQASVFQDIPLKGTEAEISFQSVERIKRGAYRKTPSWVTVQF